MHTAFQQAIIIKDLTITFGNKKCITKPFSSTISYGEKIAIIGRNGSGKSSLLKTLASLNSFYDGEIILPRDIVCGYVSQLIMANNSELSGGQLFNNELSKVMAKHANLLLLDEPTNHLDQHNRQALFGFLKRYPGTLIVITHDTELLEYFNKIWHVFNNGVNIFNGKYTEYLQRQQQEWNKLTHVVKQLDLEKKRAHEQLMQEQERSKKKKTYGEKKYDGDKMALRSAQGRGQLTANKNNARINHNKSAANEMLQELYVPEIIVPKFNLHSGDINPSKTIININNGTVGYTLDEPILNNINLQLMATTKIAILGNNGSGKSTLVKAIMGNFPIIKSGEWLLPNIIDIGYLDQHYSNLNSEANAVELLQKFMPRWSYAEIRDHLNQFLLRKNEEVNLAIKYLSGGERVRLSLALIAVRPPKVLILDEITNNIDLETKEHLLQVLRNYPGAMILICHEQNFIERLPIDIQYHTQNGYLYIKNDYTRGL